MLLILLLFSFAAFGDMDWEKHIAFLVASVLGVLKLREEWQKRRPELFFYVDTVEAGAHERFKRVLKFDIILQRGLIISNLDIVDDKGSALSWMVPNAVWSPDSYRASQSPITILVTELELLKNSESIRVELTPGNSWPEFSVKSNWLSCNKILFNETRGVEIDKYKDVKNDARYNKSL